MALRLVALNGSCSAIVSILLAAGIGSAGDSIEVLPRWNRGDKLRFEMVKVREQTRAGKFTARANIEVDVLQATGRGFVVRWRMGEVKFENVEPLAPENRIVERVANILQDSDVLLEVDLKGKFEGVRNWKEVNDLWVRLGDAMAEELRRSGFDEAKIKGAREFIAAMHDSREKIEANCMAEADLLLAVLGKRYETDKTLILDGKAPNLFGGEPLASRLFFSLGSIDKKTGRAVISWRQQIVDEKAAARVLEKSVRDLAKGLGKSVPDGELFKEVKIEESGEVAIDIDSGWVFRVSVTRDARLGKTSQREILTITRKSR